MGFALTILQRRPAAWPEAIYPSLQRRGQRLEKGPAEVRTGQRGPRAAEDGTRYYEPDYLDDPDDAPAEAPGAVEEQIMDSATASPAIAEPGNEIGSLDDLETMACRAGHSGTERKPEAPATLVHDEQRVADEKGQRRRPVIFAEDGDTLTYLREGIGTLFGREEGLACHGASLLQGQRSAGAGRPGDDGTGWGHRGKAGIGIFFRGSISGSGSGGRGSWPAAAGRPGRGRGGRAVLADVRDTGRSSWAG